MTTASAAVYDLADFGAPTGGHPCILYRKCQKRPFQSGNHPMGGTDMPYHTYIIDALRVDNLRLHNMTAPPASSHPDLPALHTRNCCVTHHID